LSLLFLLTTTVTIIVAADAARRGIRSTREHGATAGSAIVNTLASVDVERQEEKRVSSSATVEARR
jgi:hypothetical protein